jgi:geranylgeranyl diphosphate synthase type I
MAAFVAPPSASPASPPSSLLACVDRVESALRKDALPTATRLGAMAAYHMGWVDSAGRPFNAAPGKMLRGGLCLWTCGALDGDTERTLPVAVALELIHNFTLIHDDIQDGDRQRRGRPAVWTLWGPAQAINAGDGLQIGRAHV